MIDVLLAFCFVLDPSGLDCEVVPVFRFLGGEASRSRSLVILARTMPRREEMIPLRGPFVVQGDRRVLWRRWERSQGFSAFRVIRSDWSAAPLRPYRRVRSVREVQEALESQTNLERPRSAPLGSASSLYYPDQMALNLKLQNITSEFTKLQSGPFPSRQSSSSFHI